MVDYVYVSIGMSSSGLKCPYVLLKCDCACNKMTMKCVLFGRPMSLYLIHEECEYDS